MATVGSYAGKVKAGTTNPATGYVEPDYSAWAKAYPNKGYEALAAKQTDSSGGTTVTITDIPAKTISTTPSSSTTTIKPSNEQLIALGKAKGVTPTGQPILGKNASDYQWLSYGKAVYATKPETSQQFFQDSEQQILKKNNQYGVGKYVSSDYTKPSSNIKSYESVEDYRRQNPSVYSYISAPFIKAGEFVQGTLEKAGVKFPDWLGKKGYEYEFGIKKNGENIAGNKFKLKGETIIGGTLISGIVAPLTPSTFELGKQVGALVPKEQTYQFISAQQKKVDNNIFQTDVRFKIKETGQQGKFTADTRVMKFGDTTYAFTKQGKGVLVNPSYEMSSGKFFGTKPKYYTASQKSLSGLYQGDVVSQYSWVKTPAGSSVKGKGVSFSLSSGEITKTLGRVRYEPAGTIKYFGISKGSGADLLKNIQVTGAYDFTKGGLLGQSIKGTKGSMPITFQVIEKPISSFVPVKTILSPTALTQTQSLATAGLQTISTSSKTVTPILTSFGVGLSLFERQRTQELLKVETKQTEIEKVIPFVKPSTAEKTTQSLRESFYTPIKTKEETTTTPKITTPLINFPIEPPFVPPPITLLPPFGLGTGKRKKGVKPKVKYGYTPSFTALAFNIRGKQPKELPYGLGYDVVNIRPIVGVPTRRRKTSKRTGKRRTKKGVSYFGLPKIRL